MFVLVVCVFAPMLRCESDFIVDGRGFAVGVKLHPLTSFFYFSLIVETEHLSGKGEFLEDPA